MNRSRLLFVLFSLASLLPILGSSLSRAATEDEAGQDSLTKQLSVFSDVLSLIRRAYVDEASVERLLEGALEGSTDALDPLATFVPARVVQSYQRTREIGSRRSGLTITKERGIAYILAVESASPGEVAGIERGDILADVEGRSTRTMPLWELQSFLAAEPGSQIKIKILRRGQRRDVTVTLEEFEVPRPRIEERQDVAVLRLSRLDQPAVAGVRGALEELSEAGQERLVLDLRGVAGGDAAAAYQVGGLFVQGRLGELKGGGDVPVDFRSTAAPVWQGEVAVLIDGGCLGPSEVLASILKQKASAHLVGQPSFGHAGRQAALTLSDGSQLLITDAFYTGPDGEPIDERLAPDELVNEPGRPFAGRQDREGDLILERGVELLLREEIRSTKKVA